MTVWRTEHDSMGELQVPAQALYGAQTQRAVLNFPVSGQPMPREFIRALGLIKQACATVNAELGQLDPRTAAAVATAAAAVAAGAHDAEFPVDVFQTGSGTSSNMNANEVIATLASRALGQPVHANDHVNLGQSSNDVIPSAIQLAALLSSREQLLPAIEGLRSTILRRAAEFADIVKTGRTHLMDAMPLTLAQEFGCWAAQLQSAADRICDSLRRVARLPLGGSAIGTGINAHPLVGRLVAAELTRLTGSPLESADNLFEGIAAKDECVELSGQLNACACAVMKIANDLRWMNSGPLAGLAEVALPALQPGSSIMPGKVNPVLPEAACMVCAQVMGNHMAITIAGQSGNFQLNVMLPLIARNLLESIRLLANVLPLLDSQVIAGLKVNEGALQRALSLNPILVTALNPVIGYEKGAAIAKQAYREQRPIREVVAEQTELDSTDIDRLLDPLSLTRGGLTGTNGGGG